MSRNRLFIQRRMDMLNEVPITEFGSRREDDEAPPRKQLADGTAKDLQVRVAKSIIPILPVGDCDVDFNNCCDSASINGIKHENDFGILPNMVSGRKDQPKRATDAIAFDTNETPGKIRRSLRAGPRNSNDSQVGELLIHDDLTQNRNRGSKEDENDSASRDSGCVSKTRSRSLSAGPRVHRANPLDESITKPYSRSSEYRTHFAKSQTEVAALARRDALFTAYTGSSVCINTPGSSIEELKKPEYSDLRRHIDQVIKDEFPNLVGLGNHRSHGRPQVSHGLSAVPSTLSKLEALRKEKQSLELSESNLKLDFDLPQDLPIPTHQKELLKVLVPSRFRTVAPSVTLKQSHSNPSVSVASESKSTEDGSTGVGFDSIVGSETSSTSTGVALRRHRSTSASATISSLKRSGSGVVVPVGGVYANIYNVNRMCPPPLLTHVNHLLASAASSAPQPRDEQLWFNTKESSAPTREKRVFLPHAGSVLDANASFFENEGRDLMEDTARFGGTPAAVSPSMLHRRSNVIKESQGVKYMNYDDKGNNTYKQFFQTRGHQAEGNTGSSTSEDASDKVGGVGNASNVDSEKLPSLYNNNMNTIHHDPFKAREITPPTVTKKFNVDKALDVALSPTKVSQDQFEVAAEANKASKSYGPSDRNWTGRGWSSRVLATNEANTIGSLKYGFLSAVERNDLQTTTVILPKLASLIHPNVNRRIIQRK